MRQVLVVVQLTLLEAVGADLAGFPTSVSGASEQGALVVAMASGVDRDAPGQVAPDCVWGSFAGTGRLSLARAATTGMSEQPSSCRCSSCFCVKHATKISGLSHMGAP